MVKHQTFVCPDGIKNRLTIYHTNSDNGNSPIVLIVPAMGVPAKKYHKLASALNELEIDAATIDLRGNGDSSIHASRQNNFGYATIIEQDLSTAITVLKDDYPDKPIILFGHSLGGQLSALFMGQNSSKAAGLVLSASCSVYYRSWPFPTNIGLLLFSQLSAAIALILGYYPGKKIGFADREAIDMMRDWAKNARTGKYQFRQSKLDYEYSLRSRSTPTLAINFSDDSFAPIKATEHLLSKMPRSPTTCININADELKLGQADHFSWLKKPTAVAEHVKRWIEDTY